MTAKPPLKNCKVWRVGSSGTYYNSVTTAIRLGVSENLNLGFSSGGTERSTSWKVDLGPESFPMLIEGMAAVLRGRGGKVLPAILEAFAKILGEQDGQGN